MRSVGLDLVKWTAIVTMVADHLRYLWPGADGLFVVGRLAFPLFCLAIAVNLGRSQTDASGSGTNLRYLGWMLVFALVSEIPYRWLDGGTQTFSVMPTLLLGLLVAQGVHHRHWPVRCLGVASAMLAAWFSLQLMYGLPGVLLPAAWLLARRQGGVAWGLPCLLAVAGNLTNSWLSQHLLAPITVFALASAALAVPVGCLLLQARTAWVPKVGRWGYFFYPGHLAVIKLLT